MVSRAVLPDGPAVPVSFENVTRRFPGSSVSALSHLDLRVEEGEFLVFVGPSGCGKSTTLRLLAGLEPLNEGRILAGGRDISQLPPRDRDVAMVFQNYALYPHMNVADNICFPLKVEGVPRAERKQRLQRVAEILELEDYLRRKPRALSGGQRQRVAMGRALIRRPSIFCMDEPLSNLDAQMRVNTRAQIVELQRQVGVTTIYVTHDQVEAMTMGDRVAVLRDGVLQQCDTPREIYTRPRNAFVAGFIGSPPMNLFDLPLQEANGEIPVSRSVRDRAARAEQDTLRVGIRPEHCFLTDSESGLRATVSHVEVTGADAYVRCIVDLRGSAIATMLIRQSPESIPLEGAEVRVAFQPDQIHCFSPAGERIGD